MGTLRVSALVSLGFVLSTGWGSAAPAVPLQALTPETLFQISKIWTVHLTLSRESWDTLTPPPPAPPPPGSPPRTPPLGGFIAPEGKRNGISGLNGLDFEYVHAALEFEDRRFDDVAVRLKGNGTYTPGQKFGKPSLKVDLNKFVKGQKLAGLSTLNLHNSITDAGWMNETLAYRLYRDAGVPAPRTSYARVFVTVPGTHERKYLGLYALVENVDATFVESRFGVSSGALLKPVTTSVFKDLGREWAAYNQIYDPKTDLSAADQRRLIEVCDLISNASDEVFAARFPEFFDLEALAKYLAVVSWFANPDSVLAQGQNYYLYLHPKTRALAFLPWDQDHAFGQFVSASVPPEAQQQLDIMHPWSRPYGNAPFARDVPNRFMERTFALEAFRRPYLAALIQLTRTVARPERLSAQVDELAAAIASVVAEEPTTALAASFSQTRGEASFPRPINPALTVVPIKTFVRLRHASVVAQLQALGLR